MKVYFVLPAQTIYEQQGRVAGHRHTPASRDSLRELRDLVPRLRELGATKVISSDLDEQSAALLGRRLNVPVELWQSLRRFNVGKHHGMKSSKFEDLYRTVHEEWKEHPEIPMQGGDSKLSYDKRIAATRERLLRLTAPAVLMAGAQEICALIGANSPLEHNHIYEWEAELPAPFIHSYDTTRKSQAVQSAPL